MAISTIYQSDFSVAKKAVCASRQVAKPVRKEKNNQKFWEDYSKAIERKLRTRS